MRWIDLQKPIWRLITCSAAVFAITALRFSVNINDKRLLSVALNLFLVLVLAVSIQWGTRYGIFISFLSALAFSWSLPPVRHFHFADPRVWTLLTACLLTGIVAGQLSARARREALHARRSEKELRDVIETIPAIAWSALPDGSNSYANRRWSQYTGLPMGQTAGSGWQTTIHPDDLPLHLEKWRASLATGEPFEVEVRMRRMDGQYRWHYVHGVALRDERGDILKWYGISTDVEDRRLAQDALRRSEAYLAEAQRLSKTGSWAWDPIADKVLYWSDETFRIFGLDSTERPLTIASFRQRTHPEDRERVNRLRMQAFTDKSDYDVEYRILLPDGAVKYVHVIGHPALAPNGNVLEYVGTVVDVTERKQAEEEHERLRQLEKDLAHMNRVSMMGELAASLAHEIKQPITAAVLDADTCIEWLARDQPNLDEARQAASRIILDVTRASEIIGRVRSLYTKSEPQRELISVNEIIREMIGLLGGETRRHSISIQTHLADDLPSIHADRVQLQQVLMNLMLNAIDAMKERDDAGELTIKSQLNSDEQVVISVRDTGPGLPSGHAEKIFDAFFTTKSQGTGMGLSISRSIIESHGGRLWATGDSEQGATFQFTLPSAA
jgi:PAS domain S-box-containing protein